MWWTRLYWCLMDSSIVLRVPSEDTTAGGNIRPGTIHLLLDSIQRVRETLAVFFCVRGQSSERAIVDACAKGGQENEFSQSPPWGVVDCS